MNNILIDENGILKLSDFGISTHLLDDKLAQTAIGTPYYLSPEIISNSPLTDIQLERVLRGSNQKIEHLRPSPEGVMTNSEF